MFTAILAILAGVSSSISKMLTLFKDRNFVVSIPTEIRAYWGNYIYYASPLPFSPYWGFFRNDRYSAYFYFNKYKDNLDKYLKASTPEYYPFGFSPWMSKDIENKKAFGTSEFAYQTALLFASKTTYKALRRCFKVGCKFAPIEFHERYRAAKKAKNYADLEKWLTEQYQQKTVVNTYLLGVLLGTIQKDFPEGFEKFQKLLDVKAYGFYAGVMSAVKGAVDAGLKVLAVVGISEGAAKASDLSKEQVQQLASSMALTSDDVTKMVDAGFLENDDKDDLLAGLKELDIQYGTKSVFNAGGVKSNLLNQIPVKHPIIVAPKEAKQFKIDNRDALKKPRTFDFKSLILLLLPFGSVVLVGYLVYKFVIKK